MPAEPVVIDANIGVFFAWPTDFSDITHRLIQTFLDTGRYIVVPELWNAEVVSALRKWGLHVQASTSEVRQAVNSPFRCRPRSRLWAFRYVWMPLPGQNDWGNGWSTTRFTWPSPNA